MYTPKHLAVIALDFDETIFDTNRKLYPQVPALLQKYKEKGHRIWMITYNRGVYALENMSGERYLSYFDSISNGWHGKGKKKMIENLCEHHYVKFEDVVLFDDTAEHVFEIKKAGGYAYQVSNTTGVTEEDIEQALLEHAELKQFKKQVERKVVCVGTTNEVKISAVQSVFHNHLIKGIAAESGVSSQPISCEETTQGALNRMRQAMVTDPEADIWVGIENGLIESQPGRWYDVPIIALCDSVDVSNEIIVIGAGIPVSFKGQDDFLRYQEEISRVGNRACEHFTGGHISRGEVIAQAVRIARWSICKNN